MRKSEAGRSIKLRFNFVWDVGRWDDRSFNLGGDLERKGVGKSKKEAKS